MKNFRSLVIALLLVAVIGFRADKGKIKTIDYYKDEANKGKWLELVKAELKAKRKPVLFFTATWCGPCKQFKSSLGDPLMTDALQNATLIMIDGDVDAKRDKIGSKYNITGYPSFVRIDENGNLVKKTDGGAWDENIPVNMAPVMKEFMK